MKKFGIKLNILLSQIIITRMIMMKNLRKLELILMMIYLKKKNRYYNVVILIRCTFNNNDRHYPQVFLENCLHNLKNYFFSV